MKRLFLLGLFLTVVACPAFPQFTFTSLDFPGGTLTTARGINNQGEIVGAYRITPPRHAMLIHAGNYIPLAPTSILGTHFSEAFKMNDSGEVVGEFNGDDGFTHGYLLNGGNVTTLDFPGASDTVAFGLNESGTVVGSWDLVDSAGNVIASHGFTWKDGIFSEVDFPGAADTSVIGINAAAIWLDNGTPARPRRSCTALCFHRGSSRVSMFREPQSRSQTILMPWDKLSDCMSTPRERFTDS